MTPQQAEQYRKEFKRFQQRRELLWTPRIKKALREQVTQFISTYGIRPAETSILMVNAAPIYNEVRKLYLDAGIIWGANIYAKLTKEIRAEKARMPIGLSEFLRNAILKYFEADLLNDVQDITETTREKILSALQTATEQGLGFDDTIKLIQDSVITDARARLIARTETVTAANMGASLAADRTGILLVKTWIAATDNRTRNDHREVNGITIDKSEPFNVGGYPMQQPGDRGQQGNRTPAKEICNCRCTVGFEAKRDANGRIIRVAVAAQ